MRIDPPVEDINPRYDGIDLPIRIAEIQTKSNQRNFRIYDSWALL